MNPHLLAAIGRAFEKEHGEAPPLLQLREASIAATQLASFGDSLVSIAVDRSRNAGHSWSEIGEALGMTKQAAHERASTLASTLERKGQNQLTDTSRKALVAATQEAKLRASEQVSSLHLMLALSSDKASLGGRALKRGGATPGKLRKQLPPVDDVAEGGDAATPTYSPKVKKLLEQAYRWSLSLGDPQLTSAHLVLAAVKDDGGEAAAALAGIADTMAIEAGALAILRSETEA